MLSSVTYPKIPPSLKGVKHSRTAHSTSLGLDCLDKLLEDGIPFPSIVLIDEKSSRKIGRILQRIYIAEGISHEQNVVIASPRKTDLEDIINSVPTEMASSSTSSGSIQRNHPMEEENLKIAWRFQSAPKVDASVSSSKPKYDLAKSRMKNEVENVIESIYTNIYEELWNKLETVLSAPNVEISQPGPKKAVRIVLAEIGSPLFLDHSQHSLVNFLVRLRSFIMSACATVLLTVDGAQLNSDILESIHGISDAVLNFYPTPQRSQSFDPSAQITGRLEVAKIPRLYGNSLFRPESCDYSYKDTRHTVEIRKLHLDFDDGQVDTEAIAPITDNLREMGILASDADED